MYPTPDKLCVSGPEGRFYHELHIPFTRKLRKESANSAKTEAPQNRATFVSRASVARETRILPPGSEWLYIKLYGGRVVLDEILNTAVRALVRSAISSGAAIRWFFIRYADPHDHLRIRFNGAPATIARELLPQVFDSFNPLLASGKLFRIELDTYEREIERYGGVEGMLAAEDIFFADSEAVLDILGETAGDEGVETRWRIGLMSVDQLLTDFGLDDEAKRTAMELLRNAYQKEFTIDAAGKKLLSGMFRAERKKMESLFDGSSEEEWRFAKQTLARRSNGMVGAFRRLHALAAEGKLETDVFSLAGSFSHMHINRLIRSSQRAHELVLYDFLYQIYDGRIARRTRVGSTAPHSTVHGTEPVGRA
jgi:thiopeptide-type bacteriocin biosynthesis protein